MLKALVIGCGRVGSTIALQLLQEGWDVTVVDENEDALSRLGENWPGTFIVGHGMDAHLLQEAGIEEADAVVVATDGDNTNIIIGQVAPDGRGADVRDPASAAGRRRGGRRLMYVIVAGGGKVGANVMRSLLRLGNEVTLIEQRRDRYEQLEDEFEHQVQRGDATELYVLERAGIARPPDVVLALTGDDEDNMIIGQIAREKYGVPKVIARVNDPRNQPHFDLLGISPTICATSSVMALVEHEVPEHDLIHLLELRGENLEIVEVQIDGESPSAGQSIEALSLPEGSRLISVMRGGRAEIAVGSTVLEAGDQVLAILEPGKEDELRRVLLRR
ncbi:MAG: hypothetical protein E6G12_00670 [Actinobacteria bacterium]|nr:MAG: hypothetical protein E6G12_00670 [Actinomycetota bacterium]